MEKPRIVMADDNPAFLQKLTSLLADQFEIVATAADGKSALELIRRCKPDLVILDLGLPRLNGIEVLREIVKSPEGPPVVICSLESDPEVVDAAKRAGALGYVFKMSIERDLILAVNSSLKRKVFVAPFILND